MKKFYIYVVCPDAQSGYFKKVGEAFDYVENIDDATAFPTKTVAEAMIDVLTQEYEVSYGEVIEEQ